MKIIFLLALLVLITGCENAAKELKFPVLPPDLQDCKIYYLTNEKGFNITIARCPNSTTTTNYKQGKSSHSTVVVD